jgi:hypothetical protein
MGVGEIPVGRAARGEPEAGPVEAEERRGRARPADGGDGLAGPGIRVRRGAPADRPAGGPSERVEAEGRGATRRGDERDEVAGGVVVGGGDAAVGLGLGGQLADDVVAEGGDGAGILADELVGPVIGVGGRRRPADRRARPVAVAVVGVGRARREPEWSRRPGPAPRCPQGVQVVRLVVDRVTEGPSRRPGRRRGRIRAWMMVSPQGFEP